MKGVQQLSKAKVHRRYYERNKKQILEKNRVYKLKNRDVILAKNRKWYVCEGCGIKKSGGRYVYEKGVTYCPICNNRN